MPTTIAALQANHIQYGLLVKLTIDGDVSTFATTWKPVTYNGVTYEGLGALLSISEIVDHIQSTTEDIQISLSGIPSQPNLMGIILGSNIKGSKIEIYRAFANTTTQDPTGGGVYLRFKGIVTNYNISEDVQQYSKDRTNTITLSCASNVKVLSKKVNGRRTNPVDLNKYNPGTVYDRGFDNVKYLGNQTFKFGGNGI